MKTMITAVLLLVAALVLNTEAAPGHRDPGVNRRQANQQARIREGVRSGELTRREAHTLKWKEARVAELERRLKADGTLSPADRAKLQSEMTDLSNEIYQEKHDAQTRPAKPLGTADPGVNARQANQQDRIADGVKSGELTRRETWTLERKEARVAELERRLKADGTLTVAERARLQAELNDLSKDIYRQKHDAQTR